MDNWNNEQKPDVSVSGQFSGNPYQDPNQNTNQSMSQNTFDQNTNQNTFDQNMYGQPSGGTGNFGQPQNPSGNFNGQPSVGTGYGQPQNNYVNGYGQPFANYNQPPYQGPGYANTEKEEPIGVGEWTGLLAIASFVPCIGFILMLVWAFGGTEKKSKSNFCKAYLIIFLIRLALYALLFIVWGAAIADAIGSI